MFRFRFSTSQINGIISLSQKTRFTGMPKTTVFRVVQASKTEETESEKEYDILRELDLADRFLYDGIIW